MSITKSDGKTYQFNTGCGKIYITINNNKDNKPVELFCRIGKAGGCSSSQSEGIGRLASLALKNNIPPEKVAFQLKSISCHRPEGKILSCSDAVAWALLKHIS